jgi:WD40 repeat protein
MQLVGHGGDVLGMAFSPDGSSVASCSFDRTILLWRTYDECENYMMLRGHRNAVTQVRAALSAYNTQQQLLHNTACPVSGKAAVCTVLPGTTVCRV